MVFTLKACQVCANKKFKIIKNTLFRKCPSICMYQGRHDNVIEENAVPISLERFNRMMQIIENVSVMQQDHSKVHQMLNILVHNSIE